ncbi:MAG: hypothetical protein ACJ761_03190 [Chloroflexota bacterium]
MIVVVGSPVHRAAPEGALADGLAARVAAAAVDAGSPVQLVGKTGDDKAAEEVILALSRAGIGHVALLRDPALATPSLPVPEEPIDDDIRDDDPEPAVRPTPVLDAADVDLALRYLTDFRVVVLADALPADARQAVVEAARSVDATLIELVAVASEARDDETDVEDRGDRAIALEVPAGDPDGAFALLVGRLAAAIDAGADPRSAFDSAVLASGWDRAPA